MRKAEPFAGLGGLLLLVSLWLPWYRDDPNSGDLALINLRTYSGWESLVVIDILLALLALLALAVPVVSLATKGPAKSIGTALLASAFGWLAILLVAFRLVFPAAGDVRYGAWLALAGSILAWAGSWFSLKDESTPGAVAPDIPRRRAPPREAA
jgi:hypothetical protein